MNRGRPDDVAAYVAAVVSGRLGRPVSADEPLLDQPGFDSLAIVAVVDRIERELDLELEPELLVPETFTTAGTLAAAVEHSLTASPAAAGTREGG
ncbi:phosphopantetheine-binding protein [Phytohabitans sp. LJ34]|uniref:phosphopantetheine-binding protein n=1 Tax=Phytohabitans sp. LJ34 TaxID=3452217 RepID=UPI003F88BDD4